MSRFDYVAYDDVAVNTQMQAKRLCIDLERMIDALADQRSKALALTKLEECYMWIGKAIRDDQIGRGVKIESQEERKNG